MGHPHLTVLCAGVEKGGTCTQDADCEGDLVCDDDGSTKTCSENNTVFFCVLGSYCLPSLNQTCQTVCLKFTIRNQIINFVNSSRTGFCFDVVLLMTKYAIWKVATSKIKKNPVQYLQHFMHPNLSVF